jgi:diadenosine tetraphosphate (Ap4A) HIT family hydrolase
MVAMATVFTHIIEGRIPGTFVWKDEVCVAFLSINPIAPGHTLVVPRREVDQWLDLTRAESAHLYEVSRVIGLAQRDIFPCERVGLIVAGFEVPHTHVHVIPTRNMADLSFSNAAASVGRDELESNAEAIRVRLRALDRKEVSS